MSESQEPNSKRIRFGSLKKPETGALDPEALALAPRPGSDTEDPPFPSERTIHWQPKVTEEDGGGEAAQGASPHVSFVVTQEVLLNVNEHVAQTLERELGGFLLGNRYRCPNSDKEYVIIDQYSPARFTESTDVNLAFTHEACAHLREELDGKFRGKLLVG